MERFRPAYSFWRHIFTVPDGAIAFGSAVDGRLLAAFIPALSEHHTGGTNVGRTLINGGRLGGVDVRERYFLGAAFARDLRAASPGAFSDLYGTYGPRSFLYAEMVFGNAPAVAHLIATTPQSKIFAMRTARSLSVTDIIRKTRLSVEDVRRFNPALMSRVPARGHLYLPQYVPAFGPDVTFWHRSAGSEYSSVLTDFLSLDVPVEQWDGASFDTVLTRFGKRFQATATEEGAVMATTLSYVLEERRSNRQAQILAEFRSSERIARLFENARLRRETAHASHDAASTARIEREER